MKDSKYKKLDFFGKMGTTFLMGLLLAVCIAITVGVIIAITGGLAAPPFAFFSTIAVSVFGPSSIALATGAIGSVSMVSGLIGVITLPFTLLLSSLSLILHEIKNTDSSEETTIHPELAELAELAELGLIDGKHLFAQIYTDETDDLEKSKKPGEEFKKPLANNLKTPPPQKDNDDITRQIKK